MELLHTEEQVKYYDNLMEQSSELFKLGTKYNNQELLELSNKYKDVVNIELEKYNSYIGIECSSDDSDIIKTGNRRMGKIEGKFYFNKYSKSVRCTFRYSRGGFDTHAIIQLQK